MSTTLSCMTARSVRREHTTHTVSGLERRRLGGISSSTWMSLDLSKDDPTKRAPFLQLATDLFGIDTLQLNASTSTSNFPFHVPRGRHMGMNMHSLGLGRHSTVLNALCNSSTITSGSWYVFAGLAGATADHQIDGNLVLGGYD